MNRIKKTTGLLMCLVMISGLCACSSTATETAPAVTPAPTAEPDISSEPSTDTSSEPAEAEDDTQSLDDICTLYLGGAEDATSGMEKVDDVLNDDGSYYYEYVSDDGMSCICETGRPWISDASTPEEIAKELASWTLPDGEEMAEVTVESNDEYTEKTTYPVYIVSFMTGSNEDTWSWKAYTVATDTCGLVYAIGAPADFDEDLTGLCDRYFPKLRVVDKDEALETNEGAYKTDLFAYYGMKIEDVAVDFPDLILDDSYKNSEGTTEFSGPTDMMEKMSDGFALAGPFFSVDKDGTVVGINYGGKTYSVCEISAGMPMSEAKELAKAHDFKFSRVEITHGTAKYVAIYDNGQVQLCITSDEDGDTSKTEEGDVTGNVDGILINKL